MDDQIDGEPSDCQQTSSPLGQDVFGEPSASDLSGELVTNEDEAKNDENDEQMDQGGDDDEGDHDKRDEEEEAKDGDQQEEEKEVEVDGDEKGVDGEEDKEEDEEDDGPLEKSTEDEGQAGEDSMEKAAAADQSGGDDEDEGEGEPEEGRAKKKRRLMIDDDEDDEEGNKEDGEDEITTAKSIGLETDDEDEEDADANADADEGKAKKKRRLIVNDDSDEEGEKEDNEDEDEDKEKEDEEKEKEDGDQLDKSIEGEVDGEEKEEGDGEEAGEEEGESSKVKDPAVPDLSSDDDESDDDTKRRSKVPDDFVYDFDLMMQRKKEESYRSRKRKNIDIINDNDDIIADLISQMKQSADEDFELNKNRKAATCKLRLLPVVEPHLRKIDLRESFLDAGVLGVITDWLTPLPDRSLPNLQVRETMLKLLGEFNIMDVERLKASGIGKAVMYLYKHPKETKDNKKRAGVLISSWSRPIFSLDTDFHMMSKEEREQRDFDHMTKLSENKRGRTEPKTPPSSSRKVQAESEKTLRPGDKGWIPRARVPAPSTRDYVVRPKSNVDSEMSKSGSKKAVTRLDKHLRNFREKKKLMKTQRAVPISIEGRRMTL